MIASHTQTALHTWQSMQTWVLHIRSYWLLIIAMKKARENVLQVIIRGIKCHFQDIQILTGRTRTHSSKVYGLFTALNDFQKRICSASRLLRASKFSSLDYFHCFVFRRFWWQDCLKLGGKWVTWRGHLLSNALQTQPSRYILTLLLLWSSLQYPLVFPADPVTCHSAWMLLGADVPSLLRPSRVLPLVAPRLHLLVGEVMQLFLFSFIHSLFVYLFSDAIFISLSSWRNTFGNCVPILPLHGWAGQRKRLWRCKDGHKIHLRNLLGRMNHRDIGLTLFIDRYMYPLGYFRLQVTEHLPARSYILRTCVVFLTGSLEGAVVEEVSLAPKMRVPPVLALCPVCAGQPPPSQVQDIHFSSKHPVS